MTQQKRDLFIACAEELPALSLSSPAQSVCQPSLGGSYHAIGVRTQSTSSGKSAEQFVSGASGAARGETSLTAAQENREREAGASSHWSYNVCVCVFYDFERGCEFIRRKMIF